jgi:hypothetical protein
MLLISQLLWPQQLAVILFTEPYQEIFLDRTRKVRALPLAVGAELEIERLAGTEGKHVTKYQA